MSFLRTGAISQCLLALSTFFYTQTSASGQQTQAAVESKLSFEELSAQAAAAREAGKASEAIRLYHSALAINTDWAEGWWYLGTLNYDADNYADAISAFQALLKRSPEMGPALAFLGLSEFETKDYKNSLAHLEQAQRHGYADDAELEKVATYHLAMLFNRRGEFEQATETLASQIRQRRPPDDLKVLLGLSLLRIPLLPAEIDPAKDALVHAAGEAATLLVAGNADQSADAFSKLIAENPAIPYLHYAHAEALAKEGEDTEALKALDEEIRLSPTSALPLVRIAELKLQLHQTKAALVSAKRAVALDPKSAPAHDALARTLKALGQTIESAKEFAAAKKLKSTPPEADTAQRKLYARSAGENNAPLASTPSPALATNVSESSFDAVAQKAIAAQAAGQIDAAVSNYRRALALRGDWDEGWQNLGTLCFMSGHYSDAIAALSRAAAISPRKGNVWALLGLAEFELKDYMNSRIHLERGNNLGFAGNIAAVRVAKYHLAVLLNQSGEFDKATELLGSEAGASTLDDQIRLAFGMALLRIALLPDELDPSAVPLVRLAGETASFLSQSKYDQAFSGFQQLLKMSASTPYLHYAYGAALASASRYDDAEAQLIEETKITPGSALPYLRRSSIALQLHDAEKASQLAQQAVIIIPDSAEGHYLLGRSLLELGNTADALQELESARTLAPNSPEVRFSLARAYAKAGQPDAAERERSEFERLNSMVQTKRSQTGSQAYGAIQDQNGIRAVDRSVQRPISNQPNN